VFCVFSGRGVIDLRIHLNRQQVVSYPVDDEEYDQVTIHDVVDNDQAMTGMMGATVLTTLHAIPDDEDGDGDEELDAEGDSQ
jgi:hypothetical protein